MPALKIFIGILAGGTIGYLIGRFNKKCNTGCPLSCNPWISTIMWALLGLIIASRI